MTGRRSAGLLLAALVLAGCSYPSGGGGATSASPAPSVGKSPRISGDSDTSAPTPTAPATAPPTQAPASPTASPQPAPGTVPPPWLGTRPLPERADGYGEARRTPRALDPRRFTLPDAVAALPGHGFAARVDPVPTDVLARSTWQPSCPVTRAELAYVRLTFWGFDDQRHTGELLVNAAAAPDVVEVFRSLYRERFPLERMTITSRAELDAAPTGDGNGTEGFVCRPSTGSTTTFSQHAYGLAIDVNTFQNPYVKGDLVLPELASTYLDRDDVRPGMITADGPVVRAFAAIGWQWGGAWSSLKDYQHFSANGR